MLCGIFLKNLSKTWSFGLIGHVSKMLPSRLRDVSREEKRLLALCSSWNTRQWQTSSSLKIKINSLLVFRKDLEQILEYLFPRLFLPVMERRCSSREIWVAWSVKPKADSFEKSKARKNVQNLVSKIIGRTYRICKACASLARKKGYVTKWFHRKILSESKVFEPCVTQCLCFKMIDLRKWLYRRLFWQDKKSFSRFREFYEQWVLFLICEIESRNFQQIVMKQILFIGSRRREFAKFKTIKFHSIW